MRLAVVSESPSTAQKLRGALAAHHVVAWSCGSTALALRQCRADPVELLLIDVSMDIAAPRLDGADTVRQLMQQQPCPILIVSSDVERSMHRVFAAMGHGALDVVAMPQHPDDTAALLRKIDNIGWLSAPPDTRRLPAKAAAAQQKLVAVGASAGGPAALATLLKGLPPQGLGAALLLVQHVDGEFAQGMAKWLASESGMPVRLAAAGDRPRAGEVLLAGGEQHLVLRQDGRLDYSREPADSHYHPSIDALFGSLAAHWRGAAVGVLLTGMGRDGAQGLRSMRERGFLTLAQDEASSTVYGMPRAAAELGAASEILPLEAMAPRLADLF